LGEAKKAAMAKSRDHPTFYQQHRIFRLGLIAGLVRAGGQNADAIVHGQLLVGRVEVRFITASATNAGASVVGDDQLGNTAQKLKRAHVSPKPVIQTLAPGGFDVGIGAGAQDGDKQRSRAHGAALGVVDGKGVAGIIDEELFARLMLVAEDDVQLAAPAAVELAEAAVAVAVGVVLAILLPQQLQRDVTMGLEFLVKSFKVR
jgi:Kef-type K+ transport system membrane component KefB